MLALCFFLLLLLLLLLVVVLVFLFIRSFYVLVVVDGLVPFLFLFERN